MPRPAGAEQIYPSKKREQEMITKLKELADKGDANAIGWLMVLNTARRNGTPLNFGIKVVNGQIIETRGE